MSLTTITTALLIAGTPIETAEVLVDQPILAASLAADDQGSAAGATDPSQSTVPPLQPTLPPSPTTPQDPASPPPAANDPNAIVVTGRQKSEADPLQDVNVKAFQVTQSVDKAVVGPVARTYKSGIPRPIRTGLRNFFNNLKEPVVSLNYLLQLKPGKAAETVGRFAVNSTVGVGGLIDVAKKKPFNLPRRSNGLANTLGYYGVKPGPYFFLPLVGSTTLRDMFGDTVDLFLSPFALLKPFNRPYFSIPATGLRKLDDRAERDEQIETMRQESADPYVKTRELYLKARQDEIDALHGKGKTPVDDAKSQISPAEPMAPATVPEADDAPDAAQPPARDSGANPS